MPATAPDEFPYPGIGEDDNVPADLKKLADKIQEKYNAIDLSKLVVPGGAGDDGKIAIVKDGNLSLRAMKGDGTIDEEGVFQLGKAVIGNNELGPKAVRGSNIDDGTIGSSKLLAGAVDRAKLKGTVQTARSTFDFSGGPGYVTVTVNWPEAWGDTAYTVIPTVRSAHAVSVARLSSVSKTGVTVVLYREEAAPANGASAELHLVGIHD
jgi:hypothetical protein